MYNLILDMVLHLLSKAGIKDKFLSIEKIYKVCLFNEFGDMKEFNILVNHRYETGYKTSKKVKTLKFFNAHGKFTLPNILPRIINQIPVDIVANTNQSKRRKLVSEFWRNFADD